MPHLAHHLGHPLPIWEPVRFGARFTGANLMGRVSTKWSGSERAAEDPLGARE